MRTEVFALPNRSLERTDAPPDNSLKPTRRAAVSELLVWPAGVA
jgi:hypothetical protein